MPDTMARLSGCRNVEAEQWALPPSRQRWASTGIRSRQLQPNASATAAKRDDVMFEIAIDETSNLG